MLQRKSAVIVLVGACLAAVATMGAESSTQPATQLFAVNLTGPWSNLIPQLTEEQIQQMSTEDLARALFEKGLPARILMASNSGPAAGIKRLVAEYPGYQELFDRPDCWKGLASMIDVFATQLDAAGDDVRNVNATIGMENLQAFFDYPKIQDQVAAHRKELIDANVRGLKILGQYVEAAKNSLSAEKAQAAAGSAGWVAYGLVTSTLKLESAMHPDQSMASAEVIEKLKLDNPYKPEQVKAYISQSLVEIAKFAAE